MTDSPGTDKRLKPKDGDRVLLREGHSPPRWVLLRHSGPKQLSFQSQEDALATARSMASELGVDIWTSDESAYRLLEAYDRERS